MVRVQAHTWAQGGDLAASLTYSISPSGLSQSLETAGRYSWLNEFLCTCCTMAFSKPFSSVDVSVNAH